MRARHTVRFGYELSHSFQTFCVVIGIKLHLHEKKNNRAKGRVGVFVATSYIDIVSGDNHSINPEQAGELLDEADGV